MLRITSQTASIFCKLQESAIQLSVAMKNELRCLNNTALIGPSLIECTVLFECAESL